LHKMSASSEWVGGCRPPLWKQSGAGGQWLIHVT
jgi:hypothetical protein